MRAPPGSSALQGPSEMMDGRLRFREMMKRVMEGNRWKESGRKGGRKRREEGALVVRWLRGECWKCCWGFYRGRECGDFGCMDFPRGRGEVAWRVRE